ncbi:MAG: DUF484 family protein [Alphaproteobacteria bacterium]
MTKHSSNQNSPLTEEQVAEYLRENPGFLVRHADILTPPEQDLGDGIIDFQHYLVKNLQAGSKDLKSRYELLIEFCRDNMAVQTQVHQAAIRLIRSRSLEQLLETVSLDLTSLFDVDVVRLAIESDTATGSSLDFGRRAESGIVLIEPHTVASIFAGKKQVLLVEDCDVFQPDGFTTIFADCGGIVKSCALLRLELFQVQQPVLLAFGVRYKKRFHQGQGIELLSFLAQIVAHQLDKYLIDLTL